jgi:hypothetical protein
LKVLFDHNVDRRLRRHLPGHEIKTTREMGWEELTNGELMASARTAGFAAMLTIDKNIRHEQNLDKLPLPVVVLDSISNALPALIPFVPYLEALIKGDLSCALHVMGADGQVRQFGSPRGDSRE